MSPKRRRQSCVFVVALVALGSMVTGTSAQAPLNAGDLDPTFDGDGRVTTSFTGDENWAEGVIVQPDVRRRGGVTTSAQGGTVLPLIGPASESAPITGNHGLALGLTRRRARV